MKGGDVVSRDKLRLVSLLLVLLLLGVGCSQEAEEIPTPAVAPEPQPAGATETPFVLPTLYPTETRPAQEPAATFAPMATDTPGPTVDLEQKLAEFRYTIPALNLDRRLEGNVSGTVTVVDETTGIAAILRNRGGVLLELQQALPDLELAPVPEDCERCVHFSYSLPLEGLEEEGWLQDPVLLASVDNFLTANLGPHFPEGTVVGLYRSASPYDVAHSLALTDEGTLWRWLATSGEIDEPVAAASVNGDLRAQVQDLAVNALAEEYVVTCPGTPVEQLYLNPGGDAGAGAGADADAGADTGEEGTPPAAQRPDGEGMKVTIVCPAFSLPTRLLSLYTQLDGLLAPIVDEEGVPAPPLEIPLETLLAYDREDGARLLLLQSGEAQALAPDGEVYTRTLALGEVISLTTSLVDSEVLQPGVEAYGEGVAPNSLLVRGLEGMMEAVWADGPPEALEEPLDQLDQLLVEVTGIEPATVGAPAATGTITGTLTPGATSTP